MQETDKSERINCKEWFDHFNRFLKPENNQDGYEMKETVKYELSNYEKLKHII